MMHDATTGESGPPQPESEDASVRMMVFVLNEQGLHARPAARLAQEAQKFVSEIKLGCNGQAVDAKSILDVLTLAASSGTGLELSAKGPDAAEAMETLAKLFKTRFKM